MFACHAEFFLHRRHLYAPQLRKFLRTPQNHRGVKLHSWLLRVGQCSSHNLSVSTPKTSLTSRVFISCYLCFTCTIVIRDPRSLNLLCGEIATEGAELYAGHGIPIHSNNHIGNAWFLPFTPSGDIHRKKRASFGSQSSAIRAALFFDTESI